MKVNLQHDISTEKLSEASDSKVFTAYSDRLKQASEKREKLKLEKLVLQSDCEQKYNELQKLLATNKELKDQLEKSKISVQALKELLQAKQHRANQDEESHLRIFSEKRFLSGTN